MKYGMWLAMWSEKNCKEKNSNEENDKKEIVKIWEKGGMRFPAFFRQRFVTVMVPSHCFCGSTALPMKVTPCNLPCPVTIKLTFYMGYDRYSGFSGLSEYRRAAVKTAVIILFHGSRADGSGEAARTIASEVRKQGICDIVTAAFLQRAEPDLMDAVRDCILQHADRIVVVPFFLQMGMHVTEDIPSLLNEAKERYPGLQIGITAAVGSHPLIANIVADLVDKNMHRDNS